MKIVLFALQAVALVAAVSGGRLSNCQNIECGSVSGWFPKPQQSWSLAPGPYSTEVVPANACLVGGIEGFKAQVCLDGSYPDLHCEGYDRVYVGKNGAYSGTIDVTPYCSLVLAARAD